MKNNNARQEKLSSNVCPQTLSYYIKASPGFTLDGLHVEHFYEC